MGFGAGGRLGGALAARLLKEVALRLEVVVDAEALSGDVAEVQGGAEVVEGRLAAEQVARRQLGHRAGQHGRREKKTRHCTHCDYQPFGSSEPVAGAGTGGGGRGEQLAGSHGWMDGGSSMVELGGRGRPAPRRRVEADAAVRGMREFV